MLKNYTNAEQKTDVSYWLEFMYDRNSGLAFPCDEQGNLLDGLSKEALANYKEALATPERFKTYNKVKRREVRYTEPAHGTCECGREIELVDQYLGACECECGRWYNLFGQELNDPSTWGVDWEED